MHNVTKEIKERKKSRGFFFLVQRNETRMKMRKRKIMGMPKKVEERRTGKPERVLTILEK